MACTDHRRYGPWVPPVPRNQALGASPDFCPYRPPKLLEGREGPSFISDLSGQGRELLAERARSKNNSVELHLLFFHLYSQGDLSESVSSPARLPCASRQSVPTPWLVCHTAGFQCSEHCTERTYVLSQTRHPLGQGSLLASFAP